MKRYLGICFEYAMSLAAVLLLAAFTDARVESEAASHGAVPDSILVRATGDTFKGTGTDTRFPSTVVIELPSAQPVTLRALGSGVRKKFVFKVYEGIVYADANAKLPPDPYDALINGDFAKRVVMYFLRNAGMGRIRDAWEDGFSRSLRDADITPELRADKAAFLDYFDADISKGETIEITWLPGIGLFTVVAGKRMPVIKNAPLASRLLAIWLGSDPVSGNLKKDVVRFLDSNGE